MHFVAKRSTTRGFILIGKYLRAGVMVRAAGRPPGVPGRPSSPLLANILLDNRTKTEKRGHRFVRYADDFVILVKSQRGERVMQVSGNSAHKLKLVNEDKSQVAEATDSFLGSSSAEPALSGLTRHTRNSGAESGN
jgi:RNA-directed DNA polymerase